MAYPDPHGPTPSARQLDWHARELYGFVHFTVNTFTDREWGYGDEDPAIFDPSALDCRSWVAAAKAGGLSGIILTAKHHDGFCLWPIATTDHHVGNSPFRNGAGDVVGELADACAEAELGFGLYCSPWDRSHPDYGRPAYVDVYHRQWEELLTGYGDLFELWFDGANGGDGYYGGARERREIDARSYYRFDELWERCRDRQPGAVIFSDAGPDVRWCGNEAGFTGTTSWAKVRPEGFAPGLVDDHERLAAGDPDGSVWRPVEVDVSSRPGWFFHPTERTKTGEELFAIWLASVGRGAGLNLNITPDRRGRIDERDVVELARFRGLVEAFTAFDLAPGADVTASSTAAGAPRHILSASDDEVWAAADRTAEVVVDLGRTVRVGGLRVEEAIGFGQRVSGFAVDVLHHGWYEWYRGGTIGARRIVATDGAVGRAVRIRITEAQTPAVLSRVRVYAG